MENRLLSIFLTLILTSVTSTYAQTVEETDEDSEQSLIQPQIERVEFDESLIDSEDFEIGLYTGMLSIEDFGVNSVSGLKFAYHINESYFVQLAVGESRAGMTSFEVLSGGAPLLSDDERDLKFYQINLGYNLFPGEAFVSQSTTLNSAFYLVFGLGSTDFAGDDRHTVNYGFGYRLLFKDAFSVNADLKNHVFDMDIFGEKVETNNIEYSLALSWYF
ncbi:MAG: outer membrane beta-barrel domain-containing protein [Gammaproteobacteria bacterium]|nr:outer membrane beta-barrel domain-containing protein [Gammaproteobacteria bacterium]